MGKKKFQIEGKVKRFVERENLFQSRVKIVVCVSGGIDSMTLLAVLCDIDGDGTPGLTVAHVNHGMRGSESDEEEDFVKKTCDELGIPFYVHRISPGALKERETGSLQEAARSVRYSFFEKIRLETGSDLIATGHNADDNAETVFLNLIRGGGIEALRGIPPKRDRVIRPLLCVTREEIEAYAAGRGIEYRTDSSNIDGLYARNIVRNRIFPLIRSELRENITGTINRSSSVLRLIDGFLKDSVSEIIGQKAERTGESEFFIKTEDLAKLHPALADRLIRELAFRLGGNEAGYECTKQIGSLLSSQPGAFVHFPPAFRADREAAGIRFRSDKTPGIKETRIELGEEYRFEGFSIKSAVVTRDEVEFGGEKTREFVDFDKIEEPVIVRGRREGDRMVPLGMTSSKKLSDIFIDGKIPAARKEIVPLVVANGKIIWICGFQIDDSVKITDKTSRAVKFEYFPYNFSNNRHAAE